MAIKITEDGNVMYENEPSVERELLPNITDGEQYAKEAEEALERIEEIAESIPEDYTQLSEDVEELQNNYTPLSEDVAELKNDLNQKADKTDALSAYVVETATGSIASFTDGADDVPVKDLTVAIEPVQDLHGQSSPYPAGGGKNLFDATATTSEHFSRNGETFTNTSTDTRTPVQIVAQWYNGNTLVGASEVATGTYPSRGQCTFTTSSDVTQLRIKHNGSTQDLTIYIPWVKQGTFTLSFLMPSNDPTTVGGLVIKDIMVCENGYYTPYAPYSNICPISGWTGVNVSANGINQWNEQWEVGYINASNGVDASDDTRIRSKGFNHCRPNTVYYVLDPTHSNNVSFRFYDADYNFISSTSWIGDTTFTTPANAYYFRFVMATTYGTTYNHDISINYPSTDHDYHAYNGSSVSVDWTTEAGTVYGGTLDVTTGVLTVDRALWDLGTLNWSYSETYHNFIAIMNDCILPVISSAYVPICSCYKSRTPYYITSLENNELMYNTGTVAGVLLKDSEYTDGTALKNARSGQTLVYHLATPQTYQLTPQEVATVLGQNNVFADCGSVNVQYRADTKLYIDKVVNA